MGLEARWRDVRNSTLKRTNTENLKQIFPKNELHGHSPNFHLHVPRSYLYISTIDLPTVFRCRKYVDRSWECINHSQTHECGNWDWGHAIPRKSIHKRDFRCSVLCLSVLLVWVIWHYSLFTQCWPKSKTPFIFIRNKRRIILYPQRVSLPLKKNRDMSSEGYISCPSSWVLQPTTN